MRTLSISMPTQSLGGGHRIGLRTCIQKEECVYEYLHLYCVSKKMRAHETICKYGVNVCHLLIEKSDICYT